MDDRKKKQGRFYRRKERFNGTIGEEKKEEKERGRDRIKKFEGNLRKSVELYK